MMVPMTIDRAAESGGPIDDVGYRSLASFRFHVRRFFAFSEATIAAAGLSSGQYQAMLAIRAYEGGAPITVSQLAASLFVKVNSTVELVQRLESAGMVCRTRSEIDRRRIELTLTTTGAALLDRLATEHIAEHRRYLPDLAQIVAGLGFA